MIFYDNTLTLLLLLLLLLTLVLEITTILLFSQELDKTPDELIKHQTNISELKRTFLEGDTNKTGLTEWEKRLSSSPLRSSRLDEAPMIEPLVPEDVSKVQSLALHWYSDRIGFIFMMGHLDATSQTNYFLRKHFRNDAQVTECTSKS